MASISVVGSKRDLYPDLSKVVDEDAVKMNIFFIDLVIHVCMSIHL